MVDRYHQPKSRKANEATTSRVSVFGTVVDRDDEVWAFAGRRNRNTVAVNKSMPQRRRTIGV